MTNPSLPKISFIIPALNAAGILENCLQSIRRQDYPQEQIEIIVGDAGSKDRTREMAKGFGALVVDDHGRNIEDGKRAALVHATGEYVVFIDADNEITHPDYIRRAVEALAANPTAFGVESYYLPSPRMTSFCSYLTCLLHISDPVAWMMSIKPVFLDATGEVERWTFPKKSLAYPVGSNGFVFRKSELDLVRAGENYSDTHTSVNLIQATGKREWLRINGRGVHHYYVATLGEFMKKRRRATCHFLDMQKEHGFSWTERKPRIPGWLACFLCITFVFPFLQMLIALGRTRDARWLWHPWASVASAAGVAWGLQTYAFAAKDKKLIHNLQPRQKLETKP
jgi:glycosyltransferase involved in cell wall biosynthesis